MHRRAFIPYKLRRRQIQMMLVCQITLGPWHGGANRCTAMCGPDLHTRASRNLVEEWILQGLSTTGGSRNPAKYRRHVIRCECRPENRIQSQQHGTCCSHCTNGFGLSSAFHIPTTAWRSCRAVFGCSRRSCTSGHGLPGEDAREMTDETADLQTPPPASVCWRGGLCGAAFAAGRTNGLRAAAAAMPSSFLGQCRRARPNHASKSVRCAGG